jgi:hypothetical protein
LRNAEQSPLADFSRQFKFCALTSASAKRELARTIQVFGIRFQFLESSPSREAQATAPMGGEPLGSFVSHDFHLML